jgi:protein transport protein SEC13
MSLSVNSIAWAPHEHGPVLAAGSSDGSLWIVEQKGDGWVESCVCHDAHSVGVNAVHWRPVNGCGFEGMRQIVSGGCDNMVRIFCSSLFFFVLLLFFFCSSLFFFVLLCSSLFFFD